MLAGLALVLLVVAACLAGYVGRPAVPVLAVASGLWLVVNGPMEGGVLIPVTAAHGLSYADLAGLAGLGIAVWLWRQK